MATGDVIAGLSTAGHDAVVAAAVAALEERLQTVLVTLPGHSGAVPGTYGPKDLPAYTVTYPVTVPNPNC